MNLKKEKTMILIGVCMIILGMIVFCFNFNTSWNLLLPKSVVSLQYLYTCPTCGTEDCEGDYSFSLGNGIETCETCKYTRGYYDFKDSILFDK